jgi:hypothetical protein
MREHQHRNNPRKESSPRCYQHCIAREPGTCHPAAHGGICNVQHCNCGAIREVNATGHQHHRREYGEWFMPEAVEHYPRPRPSGNMHQDYYNDFRQGQWADPDPARCLCHGRGWVISDVDTVHKCREHYHGQPHPEDDNDERRSYSAELTIRPVAWGHDARIVKNLISQYLAPATITACRFHPAQTFGRTRHDLPGTVICTVTGLYGTPDQITAYLDRFLTKRSITVHPR